MPIRLFFAGLCLLGGAILIAVSWASLTWLGVAVAGVTIISSTALILLGSLTILSVIGFAVAGLLGFWVWMTSSASSIRLVEESAHIYGAVSTVRAGRSAPDYQAFTDAELEAIDDACLSDSGKVQIYIAADGASQVLHPVVGLILATMKKPFQSDCQREVDNLSPEKQRALYAATGQMPSDK